MPVAPPRSSTDVADFRAGATRFPGRPTPAAGESLQSWLRRYAWMFGTSYGQFISALDLTPQQRRSVSSWRCRLPDAPAARLEEQTGVERALLQSMTLERYDRRLIEVRGDGTIARKYWARGSGSRYCPKCVAEDGGAFQNVWQLATTFLCLRHDLVLIDGCQDCHLIHFTQRPTTDVFDPRFCASRRTGEGACGGYLPGHHAEPVAADSPLVRAQHYIDGLARVADAATAKAMLLNLEGVMHGVRKGASVEEVADHAGLEAGDLRGLQPSSERDQPPNSALDYGALAAWAADLVTASEEDVRPDFRKLVLNYDWADLHEHSSTGLGSPDHLGSRWSPNLAPSTRNRLLRAVDDQLTLKQRIQHATAATAPTRAAAASFIAPAIWAEWAVALDAGGAYNESAFRLAMSAALALVSTGDADPGSNVKYQPYKEAIRPELFATTAEVLTEQLRLLTALAPRITPTAKNAINYTQRAHAIFRHQLLPASAWKRIADRVGIHAGGTTRTLMARRYAYARMTGSHGSAYPDSWSRARTDDASLYGAFCLSMTKELQEEIDVYLRHYFGVAKLKGPVVSAPAVDLLSSPRLPGRALSDIDVAKMHDLLNGGERRIGFLANALDRSEMHVRAAADAFPRSAAAASSSPGNLQWSRGQRPRSRTAA